MFNRGVGIGILAAGAIAGAAIAAYVMQPPARSPEAVPPIQESDVVGTDTVATAPAPPLAVLPEETPTARRVPRQARQEVAPPVSNTQVPTPAMPLVAATSGSDTLPSEAQRYVPEIVNSPQTVPVVGAEPEFEELTVPRHSVVGIRLDQAVSSRTAKVEDRISATLSRNVTVNGRVAVSEGARLEGTVAAVDHGGRFRESARVSLTFDTLILTDGTRMSIGTEAIVREGDPPSADAAAKVGAGTALGAIIGSMLGRRKGAVIGGVTGAAAGTATVMSGDGNEAAFKQGASLTLRLTDDLSVLVRKR